MAWWSWLDQAPTPEAIGELLEAGVRYGDGNHAAGWRMALGRRPRPEEIFPKGRTTSLIQLRLGPSNPTWLEVVIAAGSGAEVVPLVVELEEVVPA